MSLTPEQIVVRLGNFNASSVEALMKPKGIGKGGLTYINEKIAERETGLVKEIHLTKAMQWGIDHEDDAIERLSAALKLPITKNEFSIFIENYTLTGTPDSLINVTDSNTGLELRTGAEIKCPNTENHIGFAKMESGLDLKEVEPKYYWQIVSYMLLLDVDSWFFVTYDPRMKTPKRQIYIFTVKRVDADIDLLKSRLTEASNILLKTLEKL